MAKHKEPQSYKRYDLKTWISDEVRQGCLHSASRYRKAFRQK